MKKEIRIIFLVLALVNIFILSAQADDEDWQSWNIAQFSWKVSPKWTAAFQNQIKFKENATTAFYRHSELGFTYSGLADWLDVKLAYRFVQGKSAGEWLSENRYHINGKVKWNIGSWKAYNNARIEWRDRNSLKDNWRYRDQIALIYPFMMQDKKVSFIIKNEFFYDFEEDSYNLNEFGIGFKYPVTQDFSIYLGYVRQSAKSSTTDDWEERNAVELNFYYTF